MAHTALSCMPGTALLELVPPLAACHALRSICAEQTAELAAATADLLCNWSSQRAGVLPVA
jgi:hypothetical protein